VQEPISGLFFHFVARVQHQVYRAARFPRTRKGSLKFGDDEPDGPPIVFKPDDRLMIYFESAHERHGWNFNFHSLINHATALKLGQTYHAARRKISGQQPAGLLGDWNCPLLFPAPPKRQEGLRTELSLGHGEHNPFFFIKVFAREGDGFQ